MSKGNIEIPEHIKSRYFFKTVSKPDGELIHPSGCAFFVHRICSCGLLFDLIRWTYAPNLYPKLDEEYQEHLAALEKKLPQIIEVESEKRGKCGRKNAGKA